MFPTLPESCDGIPDFVRVGFSRGGKFVYAYATCDAPAAAGILYWAPAP
jgi:hypothetical protein